MNAPHMTDEEIEALWDSTALRNDRVLAFGQAIAQAAARDTARLDWLARQDLNDTTFAYVVDAPHDGEYGINVGHGPHYGKTFRDAIDAAMSAAIAAAHPAA
jgi:hypothetical protein